MIICDLTILIRRYVPKNSEKAIEVKDEKLVKIAEETLTIYCLFH